MARIYLAGKIGKNDWRDSRGILTDQGGGPLPSWQQLKHSVHGFEVTGPFFVACDHGCTHGKGTHGTEGGSVAWRSIDVARREVHVQCADAIRRADIFFAWLDEDLTAYGTLVEIGQANALGKYIVIGVPETSRHPRADEIGRFHNPKLDHLWYATMCADRIIAASDPRSAIARIREEYTG